LVLRWKGIRKLQRDRQDQEDQISGVKGLTMRKMNYPFNPRPLDDPPHKQFEQECGVCGEPLIMEIGDPMAVYVGDSGQVEGILCTQCSKSVEQ
jgi:hypothetical protein